MRTYHQLTPGERYALSALRKQGLSQGQIARTLGRAPSTISREVRRNSKDGGGRAYRPALADDIARWRRSRSRRNRRYGWEDWTLIAQCLQEEWSPEQIAGRFKRDGLMSISHETIYRYVWDDRRRGGTLHLHLRGSPKQRRKRYGAYDSRGRLAGKRPICERPAGAQNRSRVGHLEADTVIGNISDKHCVLTFVDRKSGGLSQNLRVVVRHAARGAHPCRGTSSQFARATGSSCQTSPVRSIACTARARRRAVAMRATCQPRRCLISSYDCDSQLSGA